MSSIAKNHLSKAARQGRYGDDTLVHMSKNEADSLAASAGLKELPINPKTGLPEAWVFEAATLATMLGQGIFEAGEGRKSADIQLDLIGEQKTSVLESKKKAGEAKTAKIGAIQTEGKTGMKNLSEKTGIDVEDLQKGYESTLQKSGGLAYSGGAEEKKSDTWNRIRTAFETGKENLMASIGKSMGEVEGWFEGEVGRLDSELTSLDFQKKQQERLSKKRFLGIF